MIPPSTGYGAFSKIVELSGKVGIDKPLALVGPDVTPK